MTNADTATSTMTATDTAAKNAAYRSDWKPYYDKGDLTGRLESGTSAKLGLGYRSKYLDVQASGFGRYYPDPLLPMPKAYAQYEDVTDVDFAFRRTVDISPAFLKKHGIKGLILDVDNTLTTHDNPVPAEGIREWLDSMRDEGIKLIIVSNNHPERVRPFADPLGLDFVSDSGKPLRKGYKAAMKKMGLKVQVMENIKVAAVTVNPFSPHGYSFDRDELLNAVKEALPGLPVVDVRVGGLDL